MKFRKLRSIEIFSNGSLNFTYANSTQFKQLSIHEKDYKNSPLSQKYKEKYKIYASINTYKKKYNF